MESSRAGLGTSGRTCASRRPGEWLWSNLAYDQGTFLISLAFRILRVVVLRRAVDHAAVLSVHQAEPLGLELGVDAHVRADLRESLGHALLVVARGFVPVGQLALGQECVVYEVHRPGWHLAGDVLPVGQLP